MFNEQDLMEFILQVLDLGCGRYQILNDFYHYKFKYIFKIQVLEGKIN
jgi:hypothetical protein